MECVLNNYPATGSSILKFEKKETLHVNEPFNKIDQNLARTVTEKGYTYVVFERDVIVSVTEMDFQWMRCKNLCFIREDDGKEIRRSGIVVSPNFKEAMINWNELGRLPKKIKISHGLDYAIAFQDEIIIRFDQRRCWIVKRELMEKEIFPAMPSPEQERERTFWIELRPCKMAPELNEIVVYKEKPSDFNYEITTVGRDIKLISGSVGLPRDNFHYIHGSQILFINKGKPLPASLFKKIRNF